jgi:hypothetical protein
MEIMNQTDIDIDVLDRDIVLSIIKHIPASIYKDGIYRKHNSGVYVHGIPYDPISSIASIEYKESEQRGYFKLDFLNNSLYTGIRDEPHLIELMEREPEWSLLQHQEVVSNLHHVHNHIDVLHVLQPSSIVKLAEVLAIIRPAKRYLLNESKDRIEKEVWTKPTDDTYYFKKAHAISYAVSIVVQLNLICEQVVSTDA